jgi:hypothetical protein
MKKIKAPVSRPRKKRVKDDDPFLAWVREEPDDLPARRKLRSEDPVLTGVSKGVKAWKRYQANQEYDRDAIYDYLTVVFEVIREWRIEGKAYQYSLKALKRADFPIRMKPDPYNRLIYCSSEGSDTKKRHKWAKVMRWVARHNKKHRAFAVFVKKNGGLNKCAESAADGFSPDWI